MKKISILLLIFNTLTITGFTQDLIIKTTKDTIKCQVKEIGDDEIKYTQKAFREIFFLGLIKTG